MKSLLPFLAILLLPLAALAQERSFGWKPSEHGIPGEPIEEHPAFMAAPLPSTASVREWFYFTDQGNRGACVAFTGAELYDAVHQKDFAGWHTYLSFLDVYQRCLVMDGNFPKDSGTYGSTLCKVLEAGSLLEKTWPYSKSLRVLPPNDWNNQAERVRHKATKTYVIPNNDNGFRVKQAIANLRVGVAMGTYWYGNQYSSKLVRCTTIDQVTNKKLTVNRHILPMPKGRPVGGHEVPIVSYDDNMKFPDGNVGGVEIHNHWKGFGDSIGCAWVPYAMVFNTKYSEDKHVIEIVAP